MSESLAAAFLAPLSQGYFQKALLGGSLVAIVCAVVGCLVILRRMSFLGDALSHAMIAGVAGGYLFMKVLFGVEAHALAMLVGSIIAALVTVGLIGFVARVSRVKEDAAIGIMYSGVFAVGVVMVSMFSHYIHIDLMHFIMGDILSVANEDLWVSACVAAFVLSVIILFYRTFLLASFDPVMAAAVGVPVVLVDYGLTMCVSLVVVSAVNMVGVILVVGFLITPAATAYLLCDRLNRMMVVAALFGVTSVVGGLYLCVWLDSAGGGAVVLFCTLQFLVVLLCAPRYGLLAAWLRRRRQVPQQVRENVLVTLIRHEGPMTVEQLAERLDETSSQLKRTLTQLCEQSLVTIGVDGYALSESGIAEGRQIWRAHRIWEAYLAHVGAEPATIHAKAHQLEHVHGSDVVGYLDDLLGHPTVDPHGSKIPEDPYSVRPGRTVKLSELRAGRRGQVIEILMPDCPVAVGETVEIGPRSSDGQNWTVRAGSRTVSISHPVADSVLVEIIE